MKKAFLAVMLLATLFERAAAQEPVIPLYRDKVPNAKPSTLQEKTETGDGIVRVSNVTIPTLTVYRAAQPNGTAVIICPGGGYGILAIDHEGYQVAKRFNEMGVTAFVLKYRLPNDASQVTRPLFLCRMPSRRSGWCGNGPGSLA
jgi:acetyl esterase/lipase